MNRWLRAWRLKKGREAGYTIMEVMIVLVVSATMFVAIAISFRGHQADIEFTQAVRSMEAEIQNMMGEVVNGYYPNGHRCNPSGQVIPPPGTPGAEQDCIFIGKLWVPDGATSEVYTLIGRRLTAGSESKNLLEAGANPISNIADAIKGVNHSYGLEITEVYSLADGVTVLGAFGYLLQLSGSLTTDTVSSGRSVLLYGFLGPNSLPNSDISAALVQLNGGVLVCLEGAGGEKAWIKIGENASQTSMVSELDIEGGPCDP